MSAHDLEPDIDYIYVKELASLGGITVKDVIEGAEYLKAMEILEQHPHDASLWELTSNFHKLGYIAAWERGNRLLEEKELRKAGLSLN